MSSFPCFKVRQSLTNFTVLLVCTFIVFSVKVQGILLDEVAPCRELLARIPITFTDVLEVNVDLTKLQECINLWTNWRDERVLMGGFSVPSPVMLTKELDRMLTQQARQTDATRPVHPELLEQPNVVAEVHQPASPQEAQHEVAEVQQPLAINRKRHRGGQEGRPEAKHHKVPPGKPSDFIHRPILLQKPYQKPKSPPEVVEQPNEVAAHQPQSSQVTLREVTRVLEAIRHVLHKAKRYKTKSKDCIDLVKDLLVTPNPPFPLRYKIKKHQVIVHDCGKVWEKLREKAADGANKQTLLRREHRLMKDRLDQIKVELDRRHEESMNIKNDNEKILIDNCEKLVLNPRKLDYTTMGYKLKYKVDLKECIEKWKQRIKWKKRTSEKERKTLSGELVTLKAELDRVEDLIGVQEQDQSALNLAAGPSGVRRGRPKHPKVVAPKSPPRGGSNRNMAIPRSKHSKKARNRMVDEPQDEYTQMIKCENLIRSIPNRVQEYYAILQYWTNLVDCIEMWERLNGQARHTQEQKAIRTKELERMRTEKARVDGLINEKTLGHGTALNEDIEPESTFSHGRLSPESLSPLSFSSGSLSPGRLNPALISPESLSSGSLSPLSFNSGSLSPGRLNPALISPESLSPKPPSSGSLSPRSFSFGRRSPGQLSPLSFSSGSLSPGRLSPVLISPESPSSGSLSPLSFNSGSLSSGRLNPALISPESLSPKSPSSGSLSPGSLSPGSLSPLSFSSGSLSHGRLSPLSFSSGSLSPGRLSPALISPESANPLQWSNLMPRPQATVQQLNEAIKEKVNKPVPGFSKKSPRSNHSD